MNADQVRPIDREQAMARIRGSSLAPFADAIVSALCPSVRLLREPVDLDALPLGSSRFGGAPDLPSSITWPTREIAEAKGFLRRKKATRPGGLDFLAQIDVADLPRASVPEEFPTRGMLWFFYDVIEQPWGHAEGDQDGARVYYAEHPGELARTPVPGGRETFRCCQIETASAWTLPGEDMPFDTDDEGVAEEYREDLLVAISGDPNEVLHRMFGFPQSIQDDALGEDEDRVLLLQVDSDDSQTGPGWMWGDTGRVYLTMTRTQLADRDFAAARMRVQCY